MNMKILPALVAFCDVLLSSAVASDAPPLPKECHLKSGAVLHHVTVLKWGRDSVTLKHDGGADPVRYSIMVESDRAAFKAGRDYNAANPTPAVTAEAPVVSFTGQAFINTSDGPIKVGGMTIYAFPATTSSLFDDAMADPWTPMTVKLPKPLAIGLTDGDGNFEWWYQEPTLSSFSRWHGAALAEGFT